MGFFRRTADVPTFSHYRRYKPQLRLDFRFQCAYCEQTEAYCRTADVFGVDHFRPKKLFADLDCHYPNLYYCCNTCNWSKGVKWPNDEERRRGCEFTDPCVSDPYGDHIQVHPDGHVSAKSPAGVFTIDHLRLDRTECRRFRVRRYLLHQRIEQCKALLRTIAR